MLLYLAFKICNPYPKIDVRLLEIVASGRLQAAFGTGLPNPGHSKTAVEPGFTITYSGELYNNAGGPRAIKSTFTVTFCCVFISVPVIVFTAEHQYVPESALVTDCSTNAPVESCVAVEIG